MAYTLATETYPGFPAGMNVALPAQDLSDTEAQWLQDALVDFPALTRRRGPLQTTALLPQLAAGNKLTGIFSALDPQGNLRYLVTADSGSVSSLYAVNAAGNGFNTIVATLPHRTLTAPPGSPWSLIDAKPALKGGLMIGMAQQYDKAQQSTQMYWMGGINADYTTGTITSTGGSKTVTGSGTSWATTVTPGMWLFSGALVGYVESVDSNTQITLHDPSPFTLAAAAYTLTSVRGLYPRVMTGRVTCATTSPAVNGGDTAFLTQGLNSGTWNVYRYRDWAFVGAVSSVQSETGLTLGANAAINMANEQYIAIASSAGNWGIDAHAKAQTPGWLNAQYAGRQFYLNSDSNVTADGARLVYTEVDDPEAYNLGYAGTFTPVTNLNSDVQESARGIAAAYNALLIFKDTETFALNGTDPSVFSLQKIADDGALATGSIQTYNGGVIWAGRLGVHLYDGVQVQNLTLLKLGQVWKNSIATFDPTKYRMWSFIHRDHYVLFIENLAPTKAPQKGSFTLPQTRWTVVINLATNAVGMATNLNVRGAVNLPAQGQSKTLFIVNGQKSGDTGDRGYVLDADSLFDAEGTDTVFCDWSTDGKTITNIVPNGGAEVNTSGWSAAAGCTLTRDTVTFLFGSAAFKLVTTIPAAEIFTPGVFSVTGGQAYTLSFWHNAPVGKQITFSIDYYDSGGGNVVGDGGEVIDPITTGTGTWTYATHTFHVPLTTATVDFAFALDTATTAYLDGIQFEVGADAHGYVNTTVGSVTGRPALIGPVEVGGPDFFIESKKYDAGDGMRLKKWKILAANYLAQGGSLVVDTVIGLNDFGATLSSGFPTSVFTWDTLQATFRTWAALKSKFSTWNGVINGVFVPKRIKFQKQSQYFSFRIYQSSLSMQRVKLGPFMLAFRVMRQGRI